MKKLYEITGLIECVVVVAADNEDQAAKEVAGYGRQWFETGKFTNIIEFEISGIRDCKQSELLDYADVIV